MATNFPQYTARDFQIPPELQAQLEEIQKRRAAPVAPMFTPEEAAQRVAENERQYALGILGNMTADAGMQSAGGHVLKQALAARQLKTSERGTADPLTGKFTYSPEYLQQRDEADEGKIQNLIAQGRLNWNSQQEAALSRAFQAEQNALARAASRGAEPPEEVIDPTTGQVILVPRSKSYGMRPAPKGGGNPTEDERKAAGWTSQARFAFQNMRAALAEDEKAAKPTGKEVVLGMIPGKAADTASYAAMSPARQRFTTAASSLSEAVLRAATGAGVNRDEALQKVQELTPRWGEDPSVTAMKEQAAEMYIGALEARAGRALPQATAPLMPTPPGTTRNPMGPARNPAPKPAGGRVSFNDLPP